jgi:hypothetical protein
MESLSRLREAIEDHATEGKALNDEAYRTMMEDLRKVYEALPQAHQDQHTPFMSDGAPIDNADIPIIAPASGQTVYITEGNRVAMTEQIFRWTGIGVRMSPEQIGMYHAIALYFSGTNQDIHRTVPPFSDMFGQPHFKESLLWLRDTCVESSFRLPVTAIFYERLISLSATKKALIERIEAKKNELRDMRTNVDLFERTNPILTTTPFLPMKMLFAIVDKPSDLPVVFEHSMRGPDGRSKKYDTELKNNKVDKLHKLEITLELNDPEVPTFTFDCFTSRIKFGSNQNITRQLLWVIHYLECQLELPNPKTIKTLSDDKFCYKPSLVISGITGSTKDKKRAYVGDRFSITYVGKLNGN